jgi:hypothetical protein
MEGGEARQGEMAHFVQTTEVTFLGVGAEKDREDLTPFVANDHSAVVDGQGVRYAVDGEGGHQVRLQ